MATSEPLRRPTAMPTKGPAAEEFGHTVVYQNGMRARRHERVRGCATDPARRAGDDRDLAIEAEAIEQICGHHVLPAALGFADAAFHPILAETQQGAGSCSRMAS